MAGRHRRVRMDGDAGIAAQPDRYAPPERTRDAVQQRQFGEVINYDPADAMLNGHAQFVGALCVAVHVDRRRVHAAFERHEELAAGVDIEADVLLCEQLDEGGAEECFGGIREGELCRCRGALTEGPAKAPERRADMLLVVEIKGRAVLASKGLQRHIAERQHTIARAACGLGKQFRFISNGRHRLHGAPF